MSSQNVQFTECYVYHSTDGINWKKQKGPFPSSQGTSILQDEERTLKRYQDQTRQPNGSFRTYAILIRCFLPGEDVPDTFEDDQRRNFGIFW